MQHPVGGVSHSLTSGGEPFAHASLDVGGSYATLGCPDPADRWSSPTRVQVSAETPGKVVCTAYANADPASPSSARVVLERTLGGEVQRFELGDARGAPWGQLEVGEQVRLFDLSGRERARITCASEPGAAKPARTHLSLRCWDEQGQELTGQQFLQV